MESKPSYLIDDESVGDPAGVEATSEGYKKLQSIILARSKELSPKEKLDIELNAIRYKMMEYLEDDSNDLIPAGDFIKQYLKTTKVRQKIFAEYIKWNEGNLTKLLNGSRKINYDLAMILGTTFHVNPIIWLRIQDKNELVQLRKVNQEKYRDYSLDKLYEVVEKSDTVLRKRHIQKGKRVEKTF